MLERRQAAEQQQGQPLARLLLQYHRRAPRSPSNSAAAAPARLEDGAGIGAMIGGTSTISVWALGLNSNNRAKMFRREGSLSVTAVEPKGSSD
jgi:hypothetical protein